MRSVEMPEKTLMDVTLETLGENIARLTKSEGSVLTDIPGLSVFRREKTQFSSGDFRTIVPRFSEENRKTNRVLVDLLAQIADTKKGTPAQIALAWLLSQKPWIVPIPGTTKLDRLEENIGALNIRLSDDELHRIHDAVSSMKLQGARYPENMQKLVER